MHYPKDIAAYAHFICEACTVRSVLGRELSLYPADTVLVMLERARFIDLTNHWARGTLKTYQSKFNIISEFARDLRVPVLTPTPLTYPPNGEAFPLMWAQERSILPSGIAAIPSWMRPLNSALYGQFDLRRLIFGFGISS
jgi:hypothetical protein